MNIRSPLLTYYIVYKVLSYVLRIPFPLGPGIVQTLNFFQDVSHIIFVLVTHGGILRGPVIKMFFLIRYRIGSIPISSFPDIGFPQNSDLVVRD